jgi:hypothetical protein
MSKQRVDGDRPGVFADTMNSVSTQRMSGGAFSLPNVLTYSRIVAVPLVVACMYWQAILQGGLWLRLAALGIFIAAGITDFFDGYFAHAAGASNRALAGCSIRSPTSCWSPPAC